MKRLAIAAAHGWLRSPGWPIFLATLAVYVALVPWMARAWARGGDEPHYLLAAHSLVVDGDLDLGNNYTQRDYQAFYGEFFLNPHVRLRADGQQILTHNLGLSLLIAPAYAAGGLSGVLYFLALVGALLAANVYLLGYALSRSRAAAALGWVAIAFTPPVLWYVFLVYPEIIGALIVVVAVRYLVARPPGTALDGAAVAAFGLGVGALPWLSTRFLPLFGLLLAWAAWQAWRSRADRQPWAIAVGLAVMTWMAYLLFSLWLYGSASPAASYAGPIPLAVERSFALLRVARGLVGWLLDNQRGILISAPVYVAALWGSAVLLRQRPLAGLGLLAPLAASLLPVAVWGGFWTGWEYSARFLVIALPVLGAGLAYLWATGRRKVVAPLTLLLLVPSLLTGIAVIQQPLRGILSSPIELLKPTVDLERLIPAMARYAFLPAGREAGVGGPLEPEALASATALPIDKAVSALTWSVPAGESGIVLRQVDLPEFTFGWYTGRLPLAAPGAAPDTAVARIKIFSPSGGDYFSQTIYARDLPAEGPFTFAFHSPLYNGWGFPPTLLVSATGQSELQLGMLSLEPDRYRSLGLGAIWLGALAALGLVVVLAARPLRVIDSASSHPRASVHAPASILFPLLLSAAAIIYALLPHPRTYHTVTLPRSTGAVVADPTAYGGKAMEASPEAGNDPGKLAASHAELYAPGNYTLSVSIAALPGSPAVDPTASAVSVRVLAADVEYLAQRWDVPVGRLPAGEGYQNYSFEFHNPRQQALTFIVDYGGAAGVRVDKLVVTPVR